MWTSGREHTSSPPMSLAASLHALDNISFSLSICTCAHHPHLHAHPHTTHTHTHTYIPQESLCHSFVERAITLLKQQNEVVATHPNSHVYSQLQSLVDFDGFYLESEPCLVCNDPEVSYSVSESCCKAAFSFVWSPLLVPVVLTLFKVTRIKRPYNDFVPMATSRECFPECKISDDNSDLIEKPFLSFRFGFEIS